MKILGRFLAKDVRSACSVAPTSTLENIGGGVREMMAWQKLILDQLYLYISG
jgi:hypothetical protein